MVFIRVLYPGRIGICRCWFLWREENRRQNPRSKARATSKLNPLVTPGPNSNPGHISGRQALSLLRHSCSSIQIKWMRIFLISWLIGQNMFQCICLFYCRVWILDWLPRKRFSAFVLFYCIVWNTWSENGNRMLTNTPHPKYCCLTVSRQRHF